MSTTELKIILSSDDTCVTYDICIKVYAQLFSHVLANSRLFDYFSRVLVDLFQINNSL